MTNTLSRMKKFSIVALSLLMISSLVKGQLSEFTWDTGATATDCHRAAVGPDAQSWSSLATQIPTAVNLNGLAPGVRNSGFPCGFLGNPGSNSSCRDELDFYIEHPTNTGYFNVNSIELSIDYRSYEIAANLFTRGRSIRMGLDNWSGGILYIMYRVDNGSGGFTEVGGPMNTGTNGFVGAGAGQTFWTAPIGDGVWHNYRFVYDQASGIGEVFVDNISRWRSDGAPCFCATPGRALYWGGAPNGFTLGERMDAEGNVTPILDNAIIREPVVLPATLSYFNGEVQGADVVLNWGTLTETNNRSFTIERLVDNMEFEDLGTLPGAGTTNNPQDYTFTDRNPRNGTNLYRIRQTDLNGAITHYQVISVEVDLKANDLITVHPNPVSDQQRIAVRFEAPSAGMGQAQVIDLSGKIIRRMDVELQDGFNELEFDLHNLPPAVYLIKINAQGRNYTEKFLKLK